MGGPRNCLDVLEDKKNLPTSTGIRIPHRPAYGLVATPAPKFGVTVMYVIDVIQNWPFTNINNP